MRLQNLTVIFIIIIIPVLLLQSAYISNGIKTINYQSLYDTGLVTATHDAIHAYELNTINDTYSANAQTKREILNASIKMFERSLCKTCGISEFNTTEIENYIPAVVFGLYDGFYLYAPSVIPVYGEITDDTTYMVPTGEYKNKHNLKNYIYYSEQTTDNITIRYTLDNYVIVSGNLPDYSGDIKYRTMSGYLSAFNNNGEYNNNSYDGSTYQGISINDEKAKEYYKESKKFTKWFNDNIKGQTTLNGQIPEIKQNTTTEKYDPEDPDSAFTQHKRAVIKGKIETVLNSTITAYSARTWGNTFKMPKISPDNWDRVYSDVSMITFFQGKNIGLTDYNGYCVLNSNNTSEYINPNLIYFLDNTASDNYYHDIRCPELSSGGIARGYSVSRFHGRTVSISLTGQKGSNADLTYDDIATDAYGNTTTEVKDSSGNVLFTNRYSPRGYYIETISIAIDGAEGNEVTIQTYNQFTNDNILIEKELIAKKGSIAEYRYEDSGKDDENGRDIINVKNSSKSIIARNVYDSMGNYLYNVDAYIPLACYHCINSSIITTLKQKYGANYTYEKYGTVYNYVKPDGGTADNSIKTLYWSSLARERYNQPKLVEAD